MITWFLEQGLCVVLLTKVLRTYLVALSGNNSGNGNPPPPMIVKVGKDQGSKARLQRFFCMTRSWRLPCQRHIITS